MQRSDLFARDLEAQWDFAAQDFPGLVADQAAELDRLAAESVAAFVGAFARPRQWYLRRQRRREPKF